MSTYHRSPHNSASRHTREAAQFLLAYPAKWHTFSTDRATIEAICALQNIGVARINAKTQFRLRSAEKARRFLAAGMQ